MKQAIEAALHAAGIGGDIVALRPLSGGCIDNVSGVELSGGTMLVAKVGGASERSRFEAEAAGLAALAATETVLTPTPLGVFEHDGATVLLMTHIEQATATADAWRRLGRDLAALHAADVAADAGAESSGAARYGFAADNYLGPTPQMNTWHHDWVEFNRVCRLGFQLRRARDRGLIGRRDAGDVETLIDRLETYLPRSPRPALLHGDLWGGNALPAANGRIAVIDPAVSIGDGWADIAMMRLFGGFPEACYEAYESHVEDCEDADTRVAVYQIYHLLNHVNIFGGGYLGQTMALVRRLLRERERGRVASKAAASAKKSE